MIFMQDVTHTVATEANKWNATSLLALIFLLGATGLGVISAGENVHDIDVSISKSVQRWQGITPETLQRLGDMLGGTWGTVVAAVVCVAIAVKVNGRADVSFLLVAVGLRLIGLALKPVFASPRPTDDLVGTLKHYSSTGFPSGHSMSAALFGVALAILAQRHIANKASRWLINAALFFIIVLVGWSRMWSGAHWPSDVFGGWSYGLGMGLAAAYMVYDRGWFVGRNADLTEVDLESDTQ